MTSGTGSGLVLRNKEGTQIILDRFPVEGETLTSFGLTPSIIKTIAIPNDIQEWPTTALNGCTNLEKITTFGMPAKEATIVLSRDHGLQNLTNLTFFRLPSTLQNTGNGFDSLDGSGNIFPKSIQFVSFQDCFLLQIIGTSVFYRDTSLVHLDLSGCISLQSIMISAISYCSSLLRPDFSKCSSLQNINHYAFYRNSSLVQLDLSKCSLLQSIGNRAFSYCTQLKMVIFPVSLTTIGNYAFADDTALETIYWMGSGPAANIGSSAFPNGVEHVYNYNPNA